MGRESDKVIRGTAKLLFMFCFLAFSLMIGNATTVVEAAPNVLLKLQVEEPYGSGNWQETGIVRKTFENARYRLDYSISDTEGSTLEDLVVTISFLNVPRPLIPGSDPVIRLNHLNLLLPNTVDNVTYSHIGSNYNINVKFKTSVSGGVTGVLEFEMLGLRNSGPDGLVMTPKLTLTGTVVKADTSLEPLAVEGGTGPSITLEAFVSWAINKNVVNFPPLYVPEEEGYVVEYNIVATRTPTRDTDPGSWGETEYRLIDQLPDIPGLTPEVLFAKNTVRGFDGVYDPVAKTVTWTDTNVSYHTSGPQYTTYRVRVRYPKDQVDALGGVAVLELTNKARMETTLVGGSIYQSPYGTITHKIDPTLLTPVKGSLTTHKTSTFTEISGTSLEFNELQNLRYDTGFQVLGTPPNILDLNYRPKQVEFIDEGLTFVKTDGISYRPNSSEAYFTQIIIDPRYLYSVGGNWQFYYRTSDTGPWIPTGQVNAESIFCPPETTGWRWVVDNPAYAMIGTSQMFRTYITLPKRGETLPLIKQVDNKVTVKLTYPDNSEQNDEAIKSLPVINNRKIVTGFRDSGANSDYFVNPPFGSTLAPGREAWISVGGYVTKSSTIPVKGVFLAALLPPELSFKEILDVGFDYGSAPAPYTTTVISDFQGSGRTLVRIDISKETKASWDTPIGATILTDISPTALLNTTYEVPLYVGINSTQANDPNITFSVETTDYWLASSLPDIYDLVGDGKTTKQISGFMATFRLNATNAANVAKLSKGPYDGDWKVDASKVEMGDEFQYRIFFRNESAKSLTNVVLVDILPRPGDVDPLTNSPRNSTWQPILTAPVVPPLGGTAYYSTSETPNMSPVVSNGWTGTWSSTPPTDLSTVKAIKIDFGNHEFLPGSSADTYLTMKVPDAALSNRDTAKNTINYRVDEVLTGGGSSSMLPASSGVSSVIFRVPGSTIGGLVWADVNGNGLRDSGEPGMNGVQVELYGYDIGSSSYTKQGETTTAFHPTTNLPGYYFFDGLREGKYYVQFPSGNGYTLTSKNVGSDRSIDSDANPDGKTDIFDLADDTEKLGMDAGYVNLYPVSGILYYDLDGDGSYTAGADWPIPSYSVSLKNAADTVIQTTTTDSTGNYAFMVAGAGNYTIEVDATTLQTRGFRETEPVMGNTNTVASRSVTLSSVAITDQNFGFKSVNTVKAKVIWDTNGNDILTDSVDQPLAGIKVKLWDLTDSKYVGTAQITDAFGAVSFGGVILERSYRIDIDRTDVTTSAILANLVANVNLFNDLPQTPIGDQVLTGVLTQSGREAVFGYKSKDSNPSVPPTLTAYTYMDIAPLGSYETTDLIQPGVPVKLIDKATDIELESGQTDSTGKFSFTLGLAEGRAYKVIATTPTGFQITYNYSGNTKITPMTDTIEVASYSKPDSLVRFGYRSSVSMSLTASVILDVSGNDTLTDPIDQGISPIEVSINYQGAVIATKNTNSAGQVTFTEADGVIAGWNYTLTVDLASTLLDGLTLSSNFLNNSKLTGVPSSSISVSNIANGTDVKFGYRGNGSITGYATQDLDASGTRSSTDRPLPGVTMKLVGTNGLTATTTTDVDGRYSFTNLSASSYTVTLIRDSTLEGLELSYSYDYPFGSQLPLPTVDRASLVIEPNYLVYTEINFGYKSIGGIIGTVYKDVRQLGYYTPDDPPIEGVRVNLIANSAGITHEGNSYSAGDIIKTLHTGSDGVFNFGNLFVSANYKVEIVEYDGGPLKNKMLPSYDPDKIDPLTPSPTPYSTEAALNLNNPIGGPYLFGFKAASDGELEIIKKVGVGSVRVGELVPYSITIINKRGSDILEDILLKDLIPAGFKYVEGSGRLKRKGTTTKIIPSGNRPITFTLTESSGVSRLDQDEEVALSYFLIVGAGIQPGEYRNVAIAYNPQEEQISNQSSATVRVVSDPLFDDSLIFGKVFVDKNGDGEQDADEIGLGGIKLVTVRGEIITTDKQGRYHIPAVSGGRSDRGTNFTLKLDVRSLPKGAKVLTDNPRTVRLTPGVPARVNFRISLPENETELTSVKAEE